jgi:BirA family transcriptional regulator, biotin operon repressor / biotin---[acetyl-CoA-carboxylase] ligase
LLDAERLRDLLAEVPFVRGLTVRDVVGSTNDEVRRFAASGAPEGTVVVADRQTAGRGRFGRSWHSPPGTGLYLSVLLRPGAASAGLIGRYALGAAIAACEACREFAGDGIAIKWPNDLVASGRKCAGILSEVRQTPSGIELVVGVGINVAEAPEVFPSAVGRLATSLAAEAGGRGISREELAASLLRRIGDVRDLLARFGWDDVAARFLRYAPGVTGRRVRLASGDIGVTRGIDATGALRVETASGTVHVHAADSVAAMEE